MGGRQSKRRVKTMSIKFTEPQLVMMSAAARRADRCLEPPNDLKENAARNLAAKLLSAGLAREVGAKAGAAVWRRDEDAGRSYSLKLTAVGMKTIAAENETAPSNSTEDASSADRQDPAAPAAPALTAPPRKGTKIAQVIVLLQRAGRATLNDVIAATNWLPHTSRAALTGLRKRGYAIERRGQGEGASRYVIIDPAGA
jgi:hypothetical protein